MSKIEISLSQYEDFCRWISEIWGMLNVIGSAAACTGGVMMDDGAAEMLHHIEYYTHDLLDNMKGLMESEKR